MTTEADTNTNIDPRTGRDARYNYGLHATIHVQQLYDWATALREGRDLARIAGEMEYRADKAQAEWDQAEEQRLRSEAVERAEKAARRKK